MDAPIKFNLGNYHLNDSDNFCEPFRLNLKSTDFPNKKDWQILGEFYNPPTENDVCNLPAKAIWFQMKRCFGKKTVKRDLANAISSLISHNDNYFLIKTYSEDFISQDFKEIYVNAEKHHYYKVCLFLRSNKLV